MKKITIILMMIVTGFLTVSSQENHATLEQLQSMPLTGYVQLGDVDENGWFTVEYVGNENVTMTATVNGSAAAIVNGKIKLPDYGTYIVVVTVKATGYATLTVTFDDVVWEPVIHNQGYWIVFVEYTGEKTWYQLYDRDDFYFNSFDVYMTHECDHERYFYFVIDGVNYGAEDDWCPLFLDVWQNNPLIVSSDEVYCYHVETGYSYILGLRKTYDQDYGDFLCYCAYGSKLYSLPSGILGDVNNSYSVTISDVTALIDYLLSGSSIIRRNADVNRDGLVNIADVTALIDMLI